MMVSATVAPVFFAIPSRAFKTLLSLVGSLPSQSFCGAKRILAPFAPPLLSVLLNVLALSQAVAIKSLVLRLVAAIIFLTFSTLNFFFAAGTGSCQINSSLGTQGPM